MFKKDFTTAHLKEIEGKQYFVASDDTVDREGEVISIDGWDLKNFKRNPMLLAFHDPKEPIGVAESIGFKNINGKKRLVFAPKFHDITQRAREIGQMVAEGWLNTVSVGFIGKKMSEDGMKYEKQELLEISFVSVPANPNATSLALSKGISEETVKAVFKEVEEKEEEKEEVTDNASEEEVEVEVKPEPTISDVLDKISELSDKIEASRTVSDGETEKGRTDSGDLVKRLSVAIQKQSESLTREKNHRTVRDVSKNITKLAEILIRENK